MWTIAWAPAVTIVLLHLPVFNGRVWGKFRDLFVRGHVSHERRRGVPLSQKMQGIVMCSAHNIGISREQTLNSNHGKAHKYKLNIVFSAFDGKCKLQLNCKVVNGSMKLAFA